MWLEKPGNRKTITLIIQEDSAVHSWAVRFLADLADEEADSAEAGLLVEASEEETSEEEEPEVNFKL